MDRVDPQQRSSSAAMYFLVISIVQAAAAMTSGAAIGRFNYPPVLFGIALITGAAAFAFRALCGSAPEPAQNQ
jgi:hypothetical protein